MFQFIESLQISGSPYINSIIALIVFIVIAKIVDLLLVKVIKRLVTKSKSTLDDKFFEIVHKPIYYSIIIFGVILSVYYLEPEKSIEIPLMSSFHTFLLLIWLVAILQMSKLIIHVIMSKATDMTGLRADLIPLVSNIGKIVIIIGAFFVGLSIWHVDVTPILASAGIASAGIAFAAKDTISNFFGGISVFLDNPYKVGDYINLEAGQRGEVVAIGVRSTRIKTRDDILIAIPNSIIANSTVVNESAPKPNFRTRIKIGVAYGTDIDLMEDELIKIALRTDNVFKVPEPRVRFREFGDSSLNFELLCWVKEPSLRGLTIHNINKSIYAMFAELDIKIPFPQRDVHIYKYDKPVDKSGNYIRDF